jgi:hypothetical protein
MALGVFFLLPPLSEVEIRKARSGHSEDARLIADAWAAELVARMNDLYGEAPQRRGPADAGRASNQGGRRQIGLRMGGGCARGIPNG